eukprot:XP_011672896.1 PREDICTED: uncharacterized protein LOC105442461 [Strongylocentrotus purpuratus]
MGQRNRTRPIPSLVEYKTIHLQDRYSIMDNDQLGRGKATLDQGQQRILDPKGKPASASYPQLPPSLASYGGLHSFSQMAQFIPSICNQNTKRRPATLLPLTFPGLAFKQMSEGTESTVKPFYRSSMPEAFLSASSNLINSSSAVPFTKAENITYNQFGAKSCLGLECIGKSGLELQKPSSKSEPSCMLKSNKLHPIKPSRCTVHCTNCSCSCGHTKNRSPDIKNVTKDVKRKPNAIAGHRKPKGGEPNVNEPKGAKPTRKSEKKGGLKAKQRRKREPSVEAKKSDSSDQTQQSSHGHLRSNKDLYEDEEEGTSSHERRKRIHTSPQSDTSCKDHDHTKHQNKEDNEHDYFHGNVSILHPSSASLQAITDLQVHTRGTSLFEDLGERSNSQDDIGWAKDGFLEDSTLRQAILLRNQALLYNTSSNNTTAVPSNNQGQVKVVEKVTKIKKSLEASADESVRETEGNLDRKLRDIVEKKLGQPQDIRSVTWQDVVPHLGAKKAKTSRKNQTLKTPQLNPIKDPKSQLSIGSKALMHPRKNQKKKHPRDHTNCISTIPETPPEDQCSAKIDKQNLPPIEPQTLAINFGTRTSKSLGASPEKEVQEVPNLFLDTAMLSRSPKFAKMFLLPVYKTWFPSSDQTGKEDNFEGHIDGRKVDPKGHLEMGPNEDQQEKPAEPPSKPK